jgi:excinuclease ABC subunit A
VQAARALTKAGRDAKRGKQSAAGSAARRSRLPGVDRVLEVDQTPIGKTPRSCPATYVGFWDTIRKLFADTLEARMRGYGREPLLVQHRRRPLPGCEGQGVKTIEMSFLPDVKVPCEACNGARFNPRRWRCSWRGKSIGDVLR